MTTNNTVPSYYPVRVPDHPILEDIEAACDRVDEAKDALERAQRQLTQAVKDREADLEGAVVRVSTITSHAERAAILRYLYWKKQGSVDVRMIVGAFLGRVVSWQKEGAKYAYQLRRAIGPIGTQKCGTPACPNRVDIDTRQGATQRKCPACRKIRVGSYDHEAEERRIREQRRELDGLKQKSGLTDEEVLRLFGLVQDLELRDYLERIGLSRR